jgi:predicted transcriptional regulator of viral defense system
MLLLLYLIQKNIGAIDRSNLSHRLHYPTSVHNAPCASACKENFFREAYPPLCIARFSCASLTENVEEHIVDGVTVRVTGVAKTVADCFKYRNKISLDVTLQALREVWSVKRITSDDIWRYAKVCRVANVMRPYLEILA